MVVTEVKKILQASLANAEVFVDSDDNTHFEATIISDIFTNKKLIERQKMIYAVLGEHITSGAIHALSLKTFTTEEWSAKCNN